MKDERKIGANTGKGKKERRVPRRISASYLHNAGLYYLQRFSAGTGQFRRVMMRKIMRSCDAHKDQDRQECERLLDELIAAFVRSGLLDDRTYAGAKVRSLRGRGKSARAIRARLSSRGIAADLVEEMMRSEENGEAEILAAVRHAQRRRIGPFRGIGAKEDGMKSLAAMARAGFSRDTAERVLRMDRETAEDLVRTRMAVS